MKLTFTRDDIVRILSENAAAIMEEQVAPGEELVMVNSWDLPYALDFEIRPIDEDSLAFDSAIERLKLKLIDKDDRLDFIEDTMMMIGDDNETD